MTSLKTLSGRTRDPWEVKDYRKPIKLIAVIPFDVDVDNVELTTYLIDALQNFGPLHPTGGVFDDGLPILRVELNGEKFTNPRLAKSVKNRLPPRGNKHPRDGHDLT